MHNDILLIYCFYHEEIIVFTSAIVDHATWSQDYCVYFSVDFDQIPHQSELINQVLFSGWHCFRLDCNRLKLWKFLVRKLLYLSITSKMTSQIPFLLTESVFSSQGEIQRTNLSEHVNRRTCFSWPVETGFKIFAPGQVTYTLQHFSRWRLIVLECIFRSV